MGKSRKQNVRTTEPVKTGIEVKRVGRKRKADVVLAKESSSKRVMGQRACKTKNSKKVSTINRTEKEDLLSMDDPDFLIDPMEETLQSDDDDSSDVSEVEELLAGFDNEGNPKKILENEKEPPTLPIVVPKQKRFRKAYEASLMPEIFVKGKRMTQSLGKMDFEKQLCIKIQNLSGTTRILRSRSTPLGKTEFDVEHFIETKLTSWLLNQLENEAPVETLLNNLIADLVKPAFTEIWAQLLRHTQEDRIEKIFGIVADILQNWHTSLLDTLLHSMTLKQTLVDWHRKLEDKAAEKNTMIDYWLLQKQCLLATPPEFDESSICGLKPLRCSLFFPYFKDWFKQIAAPAIFDKVRLTNLSIRMLGMKKKWTVKDLAGLRSCVLNTVLEHKLVTVKELSVAIETSLKPSIFDDLEGEEILDEINQLSNKSLEEIRKEGKKRMRTNAKVKLSFKFGTGIPNNTVEEQKEYGTIPEDLQNCQSSGQVRAWLDKQNKRIAQLKFEQIFTDNFTPDNVDWNVVSVKLMNLTKKLRAAEDCKICFHHAANPLVENKRNWTEYEKTILMQEAAKFEEWKTISSLLPKPRPEFIVFYKWRKLRKGQQKMAWKEEQEETLRNVVKDATWDKLPVEVNDFLATKKQVQERFKKVLNPILRFGKFTRVEDSLMMLTLEKLKGQFGREKHFGIMTAYLPWRYESAWRDRAENLFAEYIVPWTMEEDKTLLTLAVSMSRDWSQIAKKFNSFKTRKGCLTRFKILEKRLRAGVTLEQYHNSYAMIRYNVQEYRHLKDISALLKEIMKEEVICFEGFLVRHRPPTEDELQNLILSFDRDIMASTIRVIDTYMTKREIFWTDWRKKNKVEIGQKKKTHDRRTFHAESTQSIASALHIREMKLIPKEKLTFKLSQREEEIYKYYAQFCSTKALKKDKPRPYIPLPEKLIELQDVNRIVDKESGVKLQRPAGNKNKR